MVRPSIALQEDGINESGIETVVMIPLTSHLRLRSFPGNVLIPAAASGLAKDSVAVIPQVGPVRRAFVDPNPVGHLPAYLMDEIAAAVRLVLGV